MHCNPTPHHHPQGFWQDGLWSTSLQSPYISRTSVYWRGHVKACKRSGLNEVKDQVFLGCRVILSPEAGDPRPILEEASSFGRLSRSPLTGQRSLGVCISDEFHRFCRVVLRFRRFGRASIGPCAKWFDTALFWTNTCCRSGLRQPLSPCFMSFLQNLGEKAIED